MTGSPSIARKIPTKSLALHRQELRERALARSRLSAARIISRTARMRLGSKNMCSVRQRPMPSAPNARAIARVLRRVGVRAHAQPAQPVGPAHQLVEVRRRARACTVGTAPSITSPVEPSSVIDVALAQHVRRRTRISPRARSRCAARRSRRRSTCPCRAPPPPRARSCRRARSGCPAPRACRGCPRARSRCARGSPSRRALARASASSALNTTRPTAAPGEAGRPCAIDRARARSGRASGAAAGRARPGRRARRAVLAGDQALLAPCRRRSSPRRARCACRCASAASRACPRWIVNSMSCMSR